MKSTRGSILAVWFVLGVLVVASVFITGNHQRVRQEESARKGLAWLRAPQRVFDNPGVFWVLDDINSRYCKSDSFSEELASRFLQVPRTETERAYFSFLSFSTSTQALPLKVEGRYDEWLLSALMCEKYPVSTTTMHTLLTPEESTGYDLTHKYLALTYLIKSACKIDRYTVSRAKDIAAQKIAVEAKERKYEFSDLLAEQSALLLWGGDGFLLSSDVAISIEKAQRVSGGWPSTQSETRENLHTSALATWFLVQKSGACPLE